MFCSQCGSPAYEDAKFCAKCGVQLAKKMSPGNSSTIANSPKISLVWIYLAGIIWLSQFAMVFIPGLSGARPDGKAGISLMFWTAGIFNLIWKRKSHKRWQGALIGVFVGFVLFLIAAAIAGYINSAHNHGA